MLQFIAIRPLTGCYRHIRITIVKKKINGKNWPCWHRLSLSCKYVSYYEKSDKGIDEYLKHKFNTKNYLDEEIDETVNNVLF